MGIPLLKAEVLALFLETLLYGVLISLYCTLLLVLLRQGLAARTKQRTMIPVATILLSLATAHIIVDFVRALEAFVFSSQGALVYYANNAHPLFVAKTTLYVTQTLLGDGVIIWRCYVVYNKQWKVVALPGTALLVNACAGYYVCYSFSAAKPGNTVFNVAERWITTFFSLTMSINVACTAAIAWRIFMTGRFARGSRTLMPVLVVVVETGALYSTALLGLLIAYVNDSNGQFPALDAVQPLAGIVFILIVLQIHYHLGTSATPANSKGAVIIPRYQWTPQGPRDDIADGPMYPMQSLAVQISEETRIDFTSSGSKKEAEASSV